MTLLSPSVTSPVLATGTSTPRTLSDRFADVINVKDFGAVGNGSTDDTAALQAAINYAISVAKNCYIPAGTYKTTAMLTVGGTFGGGNNKGGWKLFGDGKKADNGAGPGGTLINLTGAGPFNAIIQVGAQMWRTCEFADFGIVCTTSGSATYGLLFNSTEWSNHSVHRVSVEGSGSGFAILVGTGANGENILFQDCICNGINNWFYSNSGQSYVQTFLHCGGGVNVGGTYFLMDLVSGGGGLNVIDFNATASKSNNIANATLLQINNQSCIANFLGGRVETMTRIYKCVGGSPNLGSTVNITGMQFEIDYDPTNTYNTIPYIVETQGNTDNIVFQSCLFDADFVNCTFPIRWGGSGWANLHFKNCNFSGFAQLPYVTNDLYNSHGLLTIEQCKVDPAVTGNQNFHRPTAFERRIDMNPNTAGQQNVSSTNAYVHSGVPSNLLATPQITTSNGTIAPDSPWVAFGNTTTIVASDWNSGAQPKSSSQWAKRVVISPLSGIYQDITALDLHASNNYGFDGSNLNLVTYQVLITYLGTAAGTISLCDSVSGAVFDQYTFISGGPTTWTHVITLSAVVLQNTVTSYPRLKFQNTDSVNSMTFEFEWQYVTASPKPAFTPSDYAANSLTDEWAISAEGARFWHRLALPYKRDAFGQSATNPLNDLRSDLYLSSDTERLASYQNGTWWDHPQVTRAAAIPTTGQWACGAQVYNSAPVASGTMGWVQVTTGDLNATTQWAASTAYTGRTRVYNNNNVYVCIVGGTSAGSGGPTGTSLSITDGTCKWKYMGTLASMACTTAWNITTAYTLNQRIFNGTNVYQCTTGGISAGTGGPTGTGSGITDGTVVWKFIGALAVFKTFGAIGA